jgi:hypothetical protein
MEEFLPQHKTTRVYSAIDLLNVKFRETREAATKQDLDDLTKLASVVY